MVNQPITTTISILLATIAATNPQYPANQYELRYNGQPLEDSKTLAECGVPLAGDATLMLAELRTASPQTADATSPQTVDVNIELPHGAAVARGPGAALDSKSIARISSRSALPSFVLPCP